MSERYTESAAARGKHLPPDAAGAATDEAWDDELLDETWDDEEPDGPWEDEGSDGQWDDDEEPDGPWEDEPAAQPDEAQPAGRVARGHRVARRKPKWFRICLLVYLGILLICTGYLQIKLWVFLDQSQTEMDLQAAEQASRKAFQDALYQAPQRAFETWRSAQTGEQWTYLWYAKGGANAMETRERVSAYLDGLFAPGATQAYKDPAYTAEQPVYLIKNGDLPLVRVTVSGKDLAWSVSNVELLVAGDKSVSLTAPDNCVVRVNGTPLEAQFRQPAESSIQYDTLKQLLQEPVTWSTYTVGNLLAEPEITVEPPAGCTVFQNEEGRYLLAPTEDLTPYLEESVQFVKVFLNYYMNGYHNTRLNMNTVLGHLRRDSQAYQDILDTYDSVNWASYYLNINTRETYAGDVIVWADNCFSVDVTYDADGVMLGETVDYANATMRLYFIRTEDDCYISHFEIL